MPQHNGEPPMRVKLHVASREALIEYAQEDERRIEHLIRNRDALDQTIRDAAKGFGWNKDWVDKIDTMSLVLELRDYTVNLRDKYIRIRESQGVKPSDILKEVE